MHKIRMTLTAMIAAMLAVMFLGAPNAAAAQATDAQRSAMVSAHNAERNCGSRTLSQNSKLNNSAQAHANDMANRNYFSHYTKSPFPYNYSSSSWSARISYWGYVNGYRGENIAYGFSGVQSVVDAWMDSATHRENIRDCHFKYMGVGYNSDGNYWVVDFGGYYS